MTNDISTTVAGLLTKLYAIPSYASFRASVESGSLFEHPLAFLITEQTELGGSAADLSVPKQLDAYFEKISTQILNGMTANSSEYQFLAISQDFRVIKQLYLHYRITEKPSYIAALREDVKVGDAGAETLRLFADYETVLADAEARLHAIEDTFEFISLIDKLYLEAASLVLKNATPYIQTVLNQRIDAYNIMTALRMRQLGKAPDQIKQLFVRGDDFLTTYALEQLEYRDIVAEIGTRLGMKPEHLSITEIETHLLDKDIRTMNKAIYEGVSAARVIQYLEQLRYAISNVKVAVAGHALGLTKAEIMKRFVAYDAL